jgi:hypothetical protein
VKPRSRRVRLSTGVELRTPLLVPSVSSAGFRTDAEIVVENNEVLTVPEPWQWLLTTGTAIREALLVSAYDLHHENLPDTEPLRFDYTRTMYSQLGVVFIDSGLYEEVHGPPPHNGFRQDWSRDLLAALLDSIDEGCTNAIVVNYDLYDEGDGAYADQIAAARRFFKDRPRYASDFLLKPERSRGRFDKRAMTDFVPHAADMADFDVIGVTEKDLGDTLLDRLANLARLRRVLSSEGVDVPIHVFGALDPLFSPLYFAAGGEIFDGLTWMRYGFHRDVSLYRESVPLLQDAQTLSEPEVVRTTTILSANLRLLGALAQAMRDFAADADASRWKLFGDSVAPHLEAAHRAMLTTLKED